MDERSPLDNRSLTHTSREPEGQAWAQIGTKPSGPKPKATTESPEKPDAASSSKESSTATPAPAVAGQKPAASTSASATVKEDDALSDEGRPLQVDEDAEPERLNESAEEEEKKGEKKESGNEEESAKSKDESGLDVRDRTNSNHPQMIRSRVFIGHLKTDKCSRKEIEDLFTPYGKIIGCTLQHGYGFIQYSNEEAAKRAIRELHGLQFKGSKLVVDKTAALKKMLGENPNAPRPWRNERGEKYSRMDEVDYMHQRDYYHYARLEELERMYFDRYPPPPQRDPYYDRYYDRPLLPRDPYVDRYRSSELDRGRYFDRYSRGGSGGLYDPYYDRPLYDRSSSREYARPRDDPYERRNWGSDSVRDREPFERFDSSRRL